MYALAHACIFCVNIFFNFKSKTRIIKMKIGYGLIGVANSYYLLKEKDYILFDKIQYPPLTDDSKTTRALLLVVSRALF